MSCYCCKQGDFLKFEIRDRGYGSIFDGDEFYIHLCKDCINRLNVDVAWFDNANCYQYDRATGNITCCHEDDLLELINKLPIEARHAIENCQNIHLDYARNYN